MTKCLDNGCFGTKNGSKGIENLIFQRYLWTIWGAHTSEMGPLWPILSNFGHSQVRRSLENGPIRDHKWLKYGSKSPFFKNDPSPIVVPKRMSRAHFEPILSRSNPVSWAYIILGVLELSEMMSLPPPARSQYSMLVLLQGGQGEVRGACDGPTLGLGGIYPT